MRKSASRLLSLTALLGAFASSAQNGIPQSGFPNADERRVLVLTNRARADPQTFLGACAPSTCADYACYSAKPPLVWKYELNRSARFHSKNLAKANAANSKCGLAHVSPCVLLSNISALYEPTGSCDGSIACACKNAVATCPGSTGTDPFVRIGLFGGVGTSENAAQGYPSPGSVVNAWILEPDPDATCGFRPTNGHRASSLGEAGTMGAGGYQSWWVEDFGGSVAREKLVAGADDSGDFLANWYDLAGGPSSAQVNIDGVCTPMTLERGVAATNATWKAHVTTSGCHAYVFEFKDNAGALIRLPATGAYQTGCVSDYTATGLTACGAPTPSDAGVTVPPDAGNPTPPDAGQPSPDAGQTPRTDAGIVGSTLSDGGISTAMDVSGGCGCNSGAGASALPLAVLASAFLWNRSRRVTHRGATPFSRQGW